jgi:hypothetical protein
MVRPFLLLTLAAAALAGPWTDGRAGDERKKRLRARGGSAATEKAVAKGLAWLALHQSPSGLWDADGFMDVHDCACDGKGGGWHGERVPCGFDVEVTALATLAFLGAGHTHKAGGPHRATVARAVAALRANTARSLFGIAYATQALAEAHDLTGDAALKPAVERGLETLVSSRRPDGGWRYFPGSRMESGVPTTTAVVAALVAARRCGFEVGGGFEQPVRKWLDRLYAVENDRYKYTLNAHKLGYTPTTTNAASALWIHTLLGTPASDRRIRAGQRCLAKRRPKWSVKHVRRKVNGVMRDVQIGYLQHYYWWHGTEGLARVGGESWKAWNGALKRALLPKQRTNGHLAGSWDPAGTYGKVAGRVYSTSLCVLMLETYYRAT